MTELRMTSLLLLCQLYYRDYEKALTEDPVGTSAVEDWDSERKKYIALEVLDAYKSGELQAAIEESVIRSTPQTRSFVFMDDNGNTEKLLMSANEIVNGRWAASKAELESRGYSFICWEGSE